MIPVNEPQRMTITPPPPSGPSILHIFERALRDTALPIERAREIYNLQREIEFDLAEREYIRVRSLMERELEPVAKDAANPSTKSRYASLPQVIGAVRPIYSKHGIVIDFDTAPSPFGDTWIRVLAFLSHEAGYKKTYHVDMPADGAGAKGGAVMTRTHATGSAMTYGRRYLLLNIFNLAVGGEDDDGNAAPGKLTDEQVTKLAAAIAASTVALAEFLDVQRIETLADLPPHRYDASMAYFAKRKKTPNGAA